MFIFGSGSAIAIPYGVAAAANPSPMALGTLQETQVGISTGDKPLMGKLQFPVAIARTAGKIELKFKFANNYAKLWNDLFFGASVVAGSEIGIVDSIQTLTANAVTVVPPGGFAFARNLGVRDGTSGKQMTVVAGGSEVVGVSYSVAGAVFTFHAGQSATVFISYTYTSTAGFKSNVTNQPMGSQPVFDVTVVNSQYANLDNSINCLLRFPAVISNKMNLPMKNEDWTITEFDCGGFSDNSGNIMYINADE